MHDSTASGAASVGAKRVVGMGAVDGSAETSASPRMGPPARPMLLGRSRLRTRSNPGCQGSCRMTLVPA